MIDQEASDEVVVIGREQVDAAKPLLAVKVIDELLTLDDARTDCGSTTGQAGDTSVYVRGCCDIKVPAFEVAGT